MNTICELKHTHLLIGLCEQIVWRERERERESRSGLLPINKPTLNIDILLWFCRFCPGSCHYDEACISHHFHHPTLLLLLLLLLLLILFLNFSSPPTSLAWNPNATPSTKNRFQFACVCLKHTHGEGCSNTVRERDSERERERESKKDQCVRCSNYMDSTRLYGFHWCIPVNPLFRQWLWMLWRWRVVGVIVRCRCVWYIFSSRSTGTIIILSIEWMQSAAAVADIRYTDDALMHCSLQRKCLDF